MLLIKIGGGKQINIEEIVKDIVPLVKNGERVIIVHGANGYMREFSEKLHVPEKIITSPSGHISRYTDQNTLDLLIMVYSLANKRIVSEFQKNHINAIGLTGADGKIWQGVRKPHILSVENGKTKLIQDSLTGNVTAVNSSLLNAILKEECVPVITIPAITETGELINVDNDRAIAIMVRDLKITTFISLFEAPGLLSDSNNEESIIKQIKISELKNYVQSTQGRMRKKLLGLQEAFLFGLQKAYFGDGRKTTPIQNVMKGDGTIIQ